MCFATLFPRESMSFESPYSVEETRARLEAAFTKDTLGNRLQMAGKRSYFIVLRLRGNRIRLVCVWPWKRNGLQPYFYGRLLPYGPCARIEGVFRQQGGVTAFFGLWLALAAYGFVASLYQAYASHASVLQAFPALLMLLAGIAFTRFGWQGGRNEISLIADAIRDSLKP